MDYEIVYEKWIEGVAYRVAKIAGRFYAYRFFQGQGQVYAAVGYAGRSRHDADGIIGVGNQYKTLNEAIKAHQAKINAHLADLADYGIAAN